jgi:hypothetical protein
MDGLTALLLFVIALAILDVLAVRFGVDSREGIGDDHRR